MPVYQPWPPEAYGPYQLIERSQTTIEDFTLFCLEQDNRRFKEIPVALVPIIKAEAGKVRKSAGEIIEMFNPPRIYTYPRWYKIAVSVEELAANIELIVKDIEAMLKINQMIVVWARLEEIEEEAGRIKQALKQIPRPAKPSLNDVLEQANNVAEKAFRKATR